MPRKKKEAAKRAAAPPLRMIHGVKDPILSSGPPKDYEDWKIKNARAKELIMSTLVPGSEPWKIAEPLESAADIWKALEDRYAPKKGGNQSQSSEATAPTDAAELIDDGSAEVQQKPSGFIKFWAIENFHKTIPNRDQRLLWAILHGETPEAEKWFNRGVTRQ